MTRVNLRVSFAIRAGIVSLVLAAAVPATAQTSGEASASVPVIVDGATCLMLVEAPTGTPVPGVAYTPGVDVHGRSVVPAEGPGARPLDWLPETVTIDLSVPLADRLGGAAGTARYEADARLGRLAVGRDGGVTLDGRPLVGADVAELREACRRLEVIRRAAQTRKPAR